MVESQG
jgi:hypothetical protein